VRSLESRGLVAVTREHLGRKGFGEYGPKMGCYRLVDDPDQTPHVWWDGAKEGHEVVWCREPGGMPT
jgi:hypothetical protein